MAASGTLLQQLLACLNFTLESEDLSFFVQTKKVISMNYGSSERSWKPRRWMRLDLIFSMRDIYINSNPNPLTKFTSSSRSTELKDIFPWNISEMIMKTIPISTRIVIAMWWNRASHCEFDWKSMETETTTWSEFLIGGKAIVEQILASKERNKSKRAGLWESQTGIRVGKITIWVRSFEIEEL